MYTQQYESIRVVQHQVFYKYGTYTRVVRADIADGIVPVSKFGPNKRYLQVPGRKQCFQQTKNNHKTMLRVLSDPELA
jgi:hypothetical protein